MGKLRVVLLLLWLGYYASAVVEGKVPRTVRRQLENQQRTLVGNFERRNADYPEFPNLQSLMHKGLSKRSRRGVPNFLERFNLLVDRLNEREVRSFQPALNKPSSDSIGQNSSFLKNMKYPEALRNFIISQIFLLSESIQTLQEYEQTPSFLKYGNLSIKSDIRRTRAPNRELEVLNSLASFHVLKELLKNVIDSDLLYLLQSLSREMKREIKLVSRQYKLPFAEYQKIVIPAYNGSLDIMPRMKEALKEIHLMNYMRGFEAPLREKRAASSRKPTFTIPELKPIKPKENKQLAASGNPGLKRLNTGYDFSPTILQKRMLTTEHENSKAIHSILEISNARSITTNESYAEKVSQRSPKTSGVQRSNLTAPLSVLYEEKDILNVKEENEYYTVGNNENGSRLLDVYIVKENGCNIRLINDTYIEEECDLDDNIVGPFNKEALYLNGQARGERENIQDANMVRADAVQSPFQRVEVPRVKSDQAITFNPESTSDKFIKSPQDLDPPITITLDEEGSDQTYFDGHSPLFLNTQSEDLEAAENTWLPETKRRFTPTSANYPTLLPNVNRREPISKNNYVSNFQEENLNQILQSLGSEGKDLELVNSLYAGVGVLSNVDSLMDKLHGRNPLPPNMRAVTNDLFNVELSLDGREQTVDRKDPRKQGIFLNNFHNFDYSEIETNISYKRPNNNDTNIRLLNKLLQHKNALLHILQDFHNVTSGQDVPHPTSVLQSQPWLKEVVATFLEPTKKRTTEPQENVDVLILRYDGGKRIHTLIKEFKHFADVLMGNRSARELPNIRSRDRVQVDSETLQNGTNIRLTISIDSKDEAETSDSAFFKEILLMGGKPKKGGGPGRKRKDGKNAKKSERKDPIKPASFAPSQNTNFARFPKVNQIQNSDFSLSMLNRKFSSRMQHLPQNDDPSHKKQRGKWLWMMDETDDAPQPELDESTDEKWSW